MTGVGAEYCIFHTEYRVAAGVYTEGATFQPVDVEAKVLSTCMTCLLVLF
jgi:hypothetical protein